MKVRKNEKIETKNNVLVRWENFKESSKAITLIALVITIIVLLILAGVTIATLTGDNGILTRASDAKMETVVATVKENLHLEQIEKAMDDEEVTPETMLAEGKVKRTVQQAEDENYYMYYALKEDVVEGMQGLGKGNVASLRDVFLIDDDLNVRYIAKNGKEYGDELEEKILKDETKIRFASKAFSEYISKISGATEEEMKFEWMKNQTSLAITDPAVDSLEDLVFFPNLKTLTLGDLGGNNSPNITTMDGIENCTKLTSLTVNFGPDKDYSAVSKLGNLTYFNRYYGNDYEDIIDALKKCKTLKRFQVSNQNQVDMSRISELSDNLTSLTLNYNGITKIEGLNNKVNLISLSLERNQITKIEGLENLVQLNTLDLWNNHIEDITPLSKNTSLINLNLAYNAEIDGDRSNYTGERLVALNKIGEILDRGGKINIDVDKLGLFTNYKTLELGSQNLTTLEPLEGLTQLTSLNLDNNRLTLEDQKSQEILKSMANLKTLSLKNNNIKDISAINSLKNLKELYLVGQNNQINLKEIEDLISNLRALTVSTESLKTIVNCDVDKITELNVVGSNLTEIPDLSKFTKLVKINLGGNDISNIDMLSNVTSLKDLTLYNNNLHERIIDFSKLTNLTNLDLSNNTLWSEDLENLKVLRNNSNLTINLSNNSIIDASALLELNPNTKINLSSNINLSQDSKDKLKARFGNNVSF